jgi:hypothetical protein
MYCVIRKTKKPSVAKNFGNTNGINVLSQFNLLNTIYCGISLTWIGSINVASIIANHIFFNGKSIFANAYATREHEMRFPIIANITIANEFAKNVVNVIPDIPAHPST